MSIQTINPSTEQTLQSYPLLKESIMLELINEGHQCFLQWRRTSFAFRQKYMLILSDLLRKKKDDLAMLMSLEMGKPITAGKAEIEKCALVCEHYAEHAETYLSPYPIKNEKKIKSSVWYQPTGVIFAIMPWNFPFWQVFRFAAPNIMAGNAAILKHAPISTGTGHAIAALFLEAGFPNYLFQHFTLDNEMAAKVIAHEKIAGVTLTGSEQAGSSVAATAGRYLKKVVLELGGNDPYLVFSDACLDLAAECIVASRLSNSGQVCIAAKRIIVVRDKVDELTKKILKLVRNYKLGDPLDSKTKMGPMARKDLRDSLHLQVLESLSKGAKLLCGGEIPAGLGYYYPPTILTNVKPGMPAFDDELFGPVIAIILADNEDEAINLANTSRYGLGAAVFTRDLERGKYIATQLIDVGSCFVNGFVVSDPCQPFGGIKQSGFGRELAREGILEFINVKTVAVYEC
jgi:succinate-semialdehyde dehydrogenase/glutarate-semialdehyde dehydrogenase